VNRGCATICLPVRGNESYVSRVADVLAVFVVCIPRGAAHRFDSLGSRNAKALCVITPAAIGPQYFQEVADVVKAAAGGPPDRAKIVEIMRRHGLTPAPPPAHIS
jgi:hypothetical protein